MSTANKSSNRWLALMSATLAFIFTFLSRFTWAPLMSTVMEEFSINATQAGLYMSAFFAGYCITQIPGGIMADKLQPKYILIIATLLGGVCTALMALIGGYTMGLVVRIVNGLCSGVIMSSCSKIVTANFAPKERATGMGILLASPPIGILLANQIAPRLMHAVGWRGTFAYVSLFAVLVIVCLFLFVKPIPKAPAPAGKAGLLEGLVVYFKDPQQIILALSGFMFMFVNNGFSTWGALYAGCYGIKISQTWEKARNTTPGQNTLNDVIDGVRQVCEKLNHGMDPVFTVNPEQLSSAGQDGAVQSEYILEQLQDCFEALDGLSPSWSTEDYSSIIQKTMPDRDNMGNSGNSLKQAFENLSAAASLYSSFQEQSIEAFQNVKM